jgi:nucleoside-diphosphate-sugar epimerase
MIKSRIIMTGATGKKGSVVVAEPLRAGYHVRTMVRRGDGRSAQFKEKGRVMKLFKIAALFLLSLSISTRAAFAGEIKPYSQAEFDKLAAEGKADTARFPRRLVRYVRSASACDPGVDGAKQVQRPDDVHH